MDELKQKALKSAIENKLELIEFKLCNTFTYAVVSDGKQINTGVTLTPKNEGWLNSVELSNIEDILSTKSFDIALRAVTLALINAIGQYNISQENIEFKENIQSQLSKMIIENTTLDDNIVFIGHLRPVVAKLKQSSRDVTVFCRTKSEPDDEVYNDIFEYEGLNSASVVVITGAALIGSTADAILKFTKNAKIVILAGFSAGAYPLWYKDMGFTHIASLYLKNFLPQNIQNSTLEEVFNNPCYIHQF